MPDLFLIFNILFTIITIVISYFIFMDKVKFPLKFENYITIFMMVALPIAFVIFINQIPKRSCLNNCSKNGICINNVCKCLQGYYGDDCSKPYCPDNCSGNGICDNGKCICNNGFTGDNCGEKQCLNDCNGNGICKEGVCICAKGYIDSDCKGGCPNNCTDEYHGVCVSGKCQCKNGFEGIDCALPGSNLGTKIIIVISVFAIFFIIFFFKKFITRKTDEDNELSYYNELKKKTSKIKPLELSTTKPKERLNFTSPDINPDFPKRRHSATPTKLKM
jgi:hypothetical protein